MQWRTISYGRPPAMRLDTQCRPCMHGAALALLLLIHTALAYTESEATYAPLGESTQSEETYSAICVVAKNENRYIAEWIEYHRCLGEQPNLHACSLHAGPHSCPHARMPPALHSLPGVGRIYLYDHNSSTPMREVIQEHIDSGFVKYINFQGETMRGMGDQS
jgi:hypothetical protein